MLVEGVAISDRSQTLVYVNPALCAILGRAGDELIGRPVTDSIDPEDRGRWLKQLARCRAGEEATCELIWSRADGRRVRTVVSARSMLDRSGRAQGIFALVREAGDPGAPGPDRSVAENLPGAVYRLRIGATTPAQFFNEKITAMTGYPVAELPRSAVHPIYPLILPEHRGRVRSAIEAALRSAAPFAIEYAIRHRDGGVRYLLDCGQPVVRGDSPEHLDGIILEITERKRSERSLSPDYS